MVSKQLSPEAVAELYNAGCAKCIVQREGWQAELAPAIRHVLRFKRLEEENGRLLVKLTEANQLLQDRNQRLDEFSATLAHDIRGPLGGISMKLEYLMDHYQQGLDQRFAELLKRSMASAHRLTKIVQAMYEFAKLGSQAAVMQAVDLNQIVPECISDLHFDEQLDITVGVGALPTVWGNADLLRRVFINLINNAVKYNDKHKIVVNVGQERLLEKGMAPYAEIFVEDNGPGIRKEDQQTIFQMFSRGQDAKQEGSGIGLAVVSRIVELHFGSVRLQSSPERGAKFILSLPMDKIDFLK
jgi:signal transduction histidine kinase